MTYSKNKNNWVYNTFYSKVQEIEHILACLKEDYSSHKLILSYLELLDSIFNYKWANLV